MTNIFTTVYVKMIRHAVITIFTMDSMTMFRHAVITIFTIVSPLELDILCLLPRLIFLKYNRVHISPIFIFVCKDIDSEALLWIFSHEPTIKCRFIVLSLRRVPNFFWPTHLQLMSPL